MTTNERTTVLEKTAFDSGIAAGLGAMLGGLDPASHAPGPFAAVPDGLVVAGTERVPHTLAEAEGVAVIGLGTRTEPATHARSLWHPLAAVRVGLVRRMLREATHHLEERTSNGVPLVQMQMIRGQVADIAAETDELSHTLRSTDPAGTPRVAANVHDRVGRLSWEAGKLFGAAGFIATHTARVHYVSSLVANIWVTCGDDTVHSTTPERNSFGR